MSVSASQWIPPRLTGRNFFVFGAVFLSVLLWTLPATMLIENQVYNLWDPVTHFNNQLRILYGAGTGHAWCFLSDFLGAAWLAICPVKAIYWWFYFGGAVVNALTCALFAVLCQDLFQSGAAIAIVCGILGAMTPPVQFFLHISYNFVPRLLFVVLLILSCLLFRQRHKFWLLFAMGGCNLLLICSRLTTLTLLAVPILLLLYTAMANHWLQHPDWRSLFGSCLGLKKLLRSRQCHRWLLGWGAGFTAALILMIGLYKYYNVDLFNVAETQASGSMFKTLFDFFIDANGKSCIWGLLVALWVIWQNKLGNARILYACNLLLPLLSAAILLLVNHYSNAEYVEYLYESANPLLIAAGLLLLYSLWQKKPAIMNLSRPNRLRLFWAFVCVLYWENSVGAGSFIIYWMQSNTLFAQNIFFCQAMFLAVDSRYKKLICISILTTLAVIGVLSYSIYSFPKLSDMCNLKQFQSPEMRFFFHSNPKIVDEYDNAVTLLRRHIRPGDTVYEYIPSFLSRMSPVTTALGGIPAFSYWRDVKAPAPGEIYADHLLIWHRNSNLHSAPTQNYFFPLDSINNALLITGKYQLDVYNSAFSLYSANQKIEKTP